MTIGLPSLQKKLTPEVVESIMRDLLKARVMHEREIAMCEAAAAALESHKHYKRCDARLKKVIEAARPYTYVYVTRHHSASYKPEPDYARWYLSGFTEEDKSWVKASFLIDDGQGADVLIAQLKECRYHRESLANVIGQFENIEDLLDAEERIRALVGQISEIRGKAHEVLQGRSQYWHDSVTEHLPSVAGPRFG